MNGRIKFAAFDRMRGITLVELMVALLIGSFLMLGAITVFNQSRGTFRVNESVARLQENARFAMDTLAPDIRLASFWGMMNSGELITIPGGMAVTCAGNDVSAWALNLAVASEGANNGYDWPCDPFADAAQLNSDALIIRHGSDRPVAPTAGVFQVQSNRVVATLFNDGGLPAGFLPADSTTRNVQVHGYYVSRQSSFDDNVPSLRRYTLVGNTMQDQEIIPGVQDFQFQFGVDTDDDGSVERYVNADAAILDPADPAFLPDARIMAMRVWLLIRSERLEVGFTDTNLYQYADRPAVAFNDGFRRTLVSRTILLRNSRS